MLRLPHTLRCSLRNLVTLGKGSRVQQIDEARQIEQQRERNLEVQQFTELVRDFLSPATFYASVRAIGIDYFCGVPDSLLKNFCAYVSAETPADQHVITANEGSAVAFAAGYHMATGKTAMVYLQNSGLGNIVNPLTSLTAESVYKIPMLLLIGWRGEPGKKDEPQHMLQGKITQSILECLNVPFEVLPDYQEGADKALCNALKHMEECGTPYALLVKRQTFCSYEMPPENETLPLRRENAVELIVDALGESDAVVSTTGMLSRELYEYRRKKGQSQERDFLTVGSMGHSSAIALGIAAARPDRDVFCLDGDGSVIMHMGSLSTVGQVGLGNFKHVVINNGSHDSVGGQPTAAKYDTFSFVNAARACGYKQALRAVNSQEVLDGVARLRTSEGPCMLEVRVEKGARADLGRPLTTPVENKKAFMNFLRQK